MNQQFQQVDNPIETHRILKMVQAGERGRSHGRLDVDDLLRWIRALRRAVKWAVNHGFSSTDVEGSLQANRTVGNRRTHVVLRRGVLEVFCNEADQGLAHDYVRIAISMNAPVRADAKHVFGTGLHVGSPWAYFFRGTDEHQEMERIRKIRAKSR